MDHTLLFTPEEINVLYIEDDKDVIEVISEQLNSSNIKFNIIGKNTLQEGIEFLNERCEKRKDCPIDIVLLDLMLPNSHGVDTFKKLRKACNVLPIVIVSAHEDIACECVSLGAQDYLIKPDVTPQLLIRSIRYAIQRCEVEDRMKNIIMTSPLGYHLYELIDDELIFVGYNPSADRILNIDHSKLLNKPIDKAFPNISKELIDKYKFALNGEPLQNEITEYEDNYISHGYYKVTAHVSSLKNLTVTFEDITDQIKTNRKLQESLYDYKRLVEVAGASMFGMDFKTQKFTYVNDVMCKTLGYSREELLDMWPTDYLTPRSKREFNERVEALKRGDYVHNNVEYECITKDGNIVWVLVTTNYPSLDDPILEANAVAIDITRQKLAEKVIKKREIDAYKLLEEKIYTWKKEIKMQEEEINTNLKTLDKQIYSIN